MEGNEREKDKALSLSYIYDKLELIVRQLNNMSFEDKQQEVLKMIIQAQLRMTMCLIEKMIVKQLSLRHGEN